MRHVVADLHTQKIGIAGGKVLFLLIGQLKRLAHIKRVLEIKLNIWTVKTQSKRMLSNDQVSNHPLIQRGNMVIECLHPNVYYTLLLFEPCTQRWANIERISDQVLAHKQSFHRPNASLSLCDNFFNACFFSFLRRCSSFSRLIRAASILS